MVGIERAAAFKVAFANKTSFVKNAVFHAGPKYGDNIIKASSASPKFFGQDGTINQFGNRSGRSILYVVDRRDLQLAKVGPFSKSAIMKVEHDVAIKAKIPLRLGDNCNIDTLYDLLARDIGKEILS